MMLITTTAELMKYVEVSVDLDIVLVTPSIRKAEKRFVIPILGRTFYNEVLEFGKNGALTSLQGQLLEHINAASAPLAMWYYTQVGGVSIDSSGIYKPKNEKRWNLGEDEQVRLENAFLNTGLDGLDDLLNFLNDHLADFESYATSDERDDSFATLVPTAKVVQKVFSLLHPQVTYRALREAIRYVEPRVSDLMQEFYFHLIDTPAAQLPAMEKRLLDIAQRGIIYLAAERALITRTVMLTNEGLEVMMGERTPVSVPENSRIEAAARVYGESGAVEIHKLIAQLNANPPTGYVPPVVPVMTDRLKCAPDSKIMFF